MRSSSAEPGELKNTAVGAAFLSGFFVAITVLIFIVILAPKLFIPSSSYPILCLFGMAAFVSIYTVFSHRLHFPFLLHVVLFIILQWFGLWGLVWLVTGKVPPVLYPVFKTIQIHWEWFVTFTVLWLITVNFLEIFAKLSEIPDSPVHRGSMDKWSTELKVNLIPWEKAWRRWRLTIILTIIVSVLGVALGLIFMKTAHWTSPVTTGLLIIQSIMGWVLIASGFFYFKRAFWKTDNLEPDYQFKTVWRRGITPLLGGITVLGLIVPANFKALGNWWLINLANWILKTLWKMPANSPNPLTRINQLGNLAHAVEQSKPNLLMQILQIVVMILSAFIVIAVPIIVLTLITILVGFVLSKTVTAEVKRLRGLRGALIKIYLFWVNLWRQRSRRSWLFFGRGEKPGKNEDTADQGNKSRKNNSHLWGRGSQAIIRRGYYRLVGVARSSGFDWHPAQTPQDIASELTRMLPEEQSSISEITSDYQQARYGFAEPPAEKIRLFERVRRVIQRRLKSFKGNPKTED